MHILPQSDIPSSEITPESVYLGRRQFMLGAAGLAFASGFGHAADASRLAYTTANASSVGDGFTTTEALTPFADVTQHNNFYEFGTSKSDPSALAGRMITSPWHVTVTGMVARPATYAIDDLIDFNTLEERIYRLRCVEAWSMVIPWIGVPLAAVLNKVGVAPSAKYVRFVTLHDPERMPGQRSATSFIDWPYVEGLRLDEALHPLTLLSVGLYGKTLLPQNGAPIRLVVPWKYGFKSIKSIVRIELTEVPPVTTWSRLAPSEYGFFANVNPAVDHPRWSQEHERRLPSGVFSPNRMKTRLFNGYAQQVAGLYAGMDLERHF